MAFGPFTLLFLLIPLTARVDGQDSCTTAMVWCESEKLLNRGKGGDSPSIRPSRNDQNYCDIAYYHTLFWLKVTRLTTTRWAMEYSNLEFIHNMEKIQTLAAFVGTFESSRRSHGEPDEFENNGKILETENVKIETMDGFVKTSFQFQLPDGSIPALAASQFAIRLRFNDSHTKRVSPGQYHIPLNEFYDKLNGTLVDCKPKADDGETTKGQEDTTTTEVSLTSSAASSTMAQTTIRPTVPPDLPYTSTVPCTITVPIPDATPKSVIISSSERKEDSTLPLMIGGACGAIIAFLCIGVIVFLFVRRSKREKKSKEIGTVGRKNLSYDRNSQAKETWAERWMRERAEAKRRKESESSKKKKAKQASPSSLASATPSSEIPSSKIYDDHDDLGSFDVSTTRNNSLGSFDVSTTRKL